MNLFDRLKTPLIAGSLIAALTSPVYADKFGPGPTNEEILALVKNARQIQPHSTKAWGDDEENEVKGVCLRWGPSENGHHKLVACYEFVKDSMQKMGDYIHGFSKPYPSEILFNFIDSNNYDTLQGDVYLIRQEDGSYKRERLIEDRISI